MATSSKKGSTAKKSTSTSKTSQTAKTGKKQTKMNARRQMMAVVLFAFSVFLFAMVLFPGGSVGVAIHNVLLGLFGAMAYVYPVVLAVAAVFIALERFMGSVFSKAWQTGVLVALVGAAIEIFSVSEVSELGKYGKYISATYFEGARGGGVLGALIGYPLLKWFEKTGAIIAIILLIFVFLMLITGTTLIAFFKGVAKPVKTIGEQAETTFTNAADYFAERDKDEKKKSDFDFSVDEIPEKRENPADKLNLTEKQQHVLDTYRGVEHTEKKAPETAPANANAENPEKIKMTKEETTQEIASVQKEVTGGMVVTKEDSYRYPPLSLLEPSKSMNAALSKSELETTAKHLVDTLRSFGVETKILDISRGPTVTRYELQPCAGVKISKITNLADDIALNLAAVGVRIEAPIPGKAAVGIEVPNKAKAGVGIREILESDIFTGSKSKLTVALGRDIAGSVVVTDLSKMPHLLIAGTTGSGKSVCVNSMIMSILYKSSPEEVKLLMIDPKVVEMQVYNGIPHLLVPVVTDPRKASGALGWAVLEMEKRYKQFADNGVRDIAGFNKLAENEPTLEKMPQIVIIIDELADLMMVAPNEVEDYICRIAQKARAAGMHLVIATQRPSVDVVTGLIKANIPSRIALSVSSQIDSRTILDMAGAEKLIGHGDMLFSPVGVTKPERIQGCFVSDAEREAVINYIKGDGQANYDDDIMVEIERQAAVDKKQKNSSSDEGDSSEYDPMLNDAIEVVVELGQASTSLLQRKLKLGYSRAARIIDQMEECGVIGPYEGSKPRQVLMTKAQLDERKLNEQE